MSQILSQRGIKHSFSGHPSMSGLFFSEKPPRDYRDWVTSDYTFYEALAPHLHDLGVLCEPDSREPWFICEAHDDRCLGETLERFETAVNRRGSRAPHRQRTQTGSELGEIRRDRHRRGPQRPDQRRLSRALGAQGARGRAHALDRRRGRQPRDREGLDVLELLLRVQPAAARSCSATSTSPGTACRSCPTAAACRSPRSGDILGNYTDEQVQRREFARHNPRDADAYHRYSTDVMRQCKFIRPLLLRSPPDPTSFKPRDLKEMIFLGKELNKFGEQFIYDTLRFYSMSIADFLNEYFESDTIKCHLSGQRHHRLGDGRVLARHRLRAAAPLHGRRRRLDRRLGLRARRHGRGVEVDRERVQVVRRRDRHRRAGRARDRQGRPRHRASRPRTAPSTTPTSWSRTSTRAAPTRRSSTRRTCRAAIVEKAKNWKIRGSSGKLNIALDGLPEFPALGKDNPLAYGDMHFLDSLEKMERAYDDWKNGTWSKEPYLDLLIPSMTDPTMAPPGKHFMSVFVQYVPPFINGREWTDADRDGFKNTVLDQIGRYSPNFKSLVRHVECRTPRELEAEVGLTEGNIFQGELTMDQLLFNRPFPGYAQYRGPVRGFYMCGSGTHPGGGVMAAPGANAAREILMDLRRPNIVPEGWQDD